MKNLIFAAFISIFWVACSKSNDALVPQAPVAAFSHSVTPALPVNVQFVNTSMSTGVSSYFWDFGDGTTSALASGVTHPYASFGNFTVKLIQNDPAGSIDSVNYVINTALAGSGGGAASSNGPNFQYQVIHTAPFTVQFNNQSLNASAGYMWDFGDGNGSTTDSAMVTHVYNAPGFYLVKLVAYGTNQSDTASASLQF